MTSRVPPQLDEPKTIQVLLADNERVVARDIKACLENLGHTVPTIASSGGKAVKNAKVLYPDGLPLMHEQILLPPSLPMLVIDVTILTRILTELLTNACNGTHSIRSLELDTKGKDLRSEL